jgi:sortase (surface protein transpeptidase)
MVPLGLTADGALAVPTGDARDLAGWFTGGPRPGEVGPAVLSGHVTQGGEPSVFHRLAEVRPGTTVLVDRDDGTTASFETLRSERHPKESFPSSEVYGDVAEPQLRLITCGGEVDDATGRHRDNVIVFARLVAVRASTDGRSSTARGRRARRPGPLSPRAP